MRIAAQILLAGLACCAAVQGSVIYTFSGTAAGSGPIPGVPIQQFQYTSPGFIGVWEVVPASLLDSCNRCAASFGPVLTPDGNGTDQVQFNDSNGAGYIYEFPSGALSYPGTYQTTSVPPINSATLTVQVTDTLTALNSAGYNLCGYSNNQVCAGPLSLAPGELATIVGSNHVADVTWQASGSNSPGPQSGYTVTVTDSAGVARIALLLYISPLQVNFVIPDQTATGAATITLAGGGSEQTFPVSIANVAPGIFTFSGNGTGLPAAQIVRVASDGTQTVELATSSPIAIGSGMVYLVLYGTGIRNHAGAVTLGYFDANGLENQPAAYAGPQGQYEGLDQVDVLLPGSMSGLGQRNLWLSVDGASGSSNVVTLTFQ